MLTLCTEALMAKLDKDFALPEKGFVQWPVGTGDSTTICVTDEIVMQVDLHHLGSSEKDDDPHTPIVDRLIALLPKVGILAYQCRHGDLDPLFACALVACCHAGRSHAPPTLRTDDARP